MMETLDNLLEYYGSDSKAIIWAHNTHIGDYRATSMASHGQVNLGGLAREKYGASQVALIGLTTFSGEVIASKQWDGAIQVMSVPNAVEGSLEFALHEAVPRLGVEKFYLDFTLIQQDSQFLDVMGNRAIGVVYHPMHEHRGNYVPTIPAKRYDALLFFDKTNALTPINERFRKERYPDTFPYGDQI
jgi:erythromycin esterase-like protein